MNIKKENIPVLVASNAYVGTWSNQCIFSVYLEKNAFWKISHVDDNDMVIYTTGDNWNPKVVTGHDYHQMTIQHNNQLFAEMSPLDEAERGYLKALIKPFREQIAYISKFKDRLLDEEYIGIACKRAHDFIALPNFKKGTMYKGMEEDAKYSLEVLGL